MAAISVPGRFLLWADPNPNQENARCAEEFTRRGFNVTRVNSTQEALAWLQARVHLIPGQGHVLCSNRERAGNPNAGAELIYAVTEAGWREISSFVFCSSSGVVYYRQHHPTVRTTASEEEFIRLVTEVPPPRIPAAGPIPAPNPAHSDVTGHLNVGYIHLPLLGATQPSNLLNPPPGRQRIVLLSDTHNLTHTIDIPPCDYLFHTGDFCERGNMEHTVAFREWLIEVRPKVRKDIIVITGNHEPHEQHEELRARLGDVCTYLVDQGVEVAGGKLWGLHWKGVYALVPDDTYIFLTHQPPKGILDEDYRKRLTGSKSILAVTERIEPLIHVFGHCHEGYLTARNDTTVFVNAASANGYQADPSVRFPALVVDIPEIAPGAARPRLQPDVEPRIEKNARVRSNRWW